MNHSNNLLPNSTELAEQGKIHAVEGNHELALIYYRAAMHESQGEDNNSKLLSRYFAECSLESFEKMKEYDSVISYCDKSIAHYDEHVPQGPIAFKDLVHILQRKAVVLLKMGQKDEALVYLKKAIEQASENDFELPIAHSLHTWLMRALHFDSRRVETLLEQQQYYTINRKTIDPKRARSLPNNILATFQVS